MKDGVTYRAIMQRRGKVSRGSRRRLGIPWRYSAYLPVQKHNRS